MNTIKSLFSKIFEYLKTGHERLWGWVSRLHTAIYIIVGIFAVGLYSTLQYKFGPIKALLILVIIIAVVILMGLIISIAPDLLSGFSSLASVVIISAFASQGIAFETGFIIQPFLISLVIYFLMLSITYNPDPNALNRGLKSRWLWSSLITIAHISAKAVLVMNFNVRYWVSEGVSITLGLALILLWVLWIKNSPKTKLNHPKSVIATSEGNDEVVIRIDDYINEDNNWQNGENAIPWLFVEATLAADKGKDLIVIQRSRDDTKSFSIQFGRNIWEDINAKIIEE